MYVYVCVYMCVCVYAYVCMGMLEYYNTIDMSMNSFQLLFEY